MEEASVRPRLAVLIGLAAISTSLLAAGQAHAAMAGANPATTGLRPALRSAQITNFDSTSGATTIQVCFDQAISSTPFAAGFQVGNYRRAERARRQRDPGRERAVRERHLLVDLHRPPAAYVRPRRPRRRGEPERRRPRRRERAGLGGAQRLEQPQRHPRARDVPGPRGHHAEPGAARRQLRHGRAGVRSLHRRGLVLGDAAGRDHRAEPRWGRHVLRQHRHGALRGRDARLAGQPGRARHGRVQPRRRGDAGDHQRQPDDCDGPRDRRLQQQPRPDRDHGLRRRPDDGLHVRREHHAGGRDHPRREPVRREPPTR